MRHEKEEKTIRAMVAIYCHDHHQVDGGRLCTACLALADYALARLDKCPWGAEKPVCANCPIHCYKPAMRDEVRAVMRYAGPRMLVRHPLLALSHLIQKQKAAPSGRSVPPTPLPEPAPCPGESPSKPSPRN